MTWYAYAFSHMYIYIPQSRFTRHPCRNHVFAGTLKLSMYIIKDSMLGGSARYMLLYWFEKLDDMHISKFGVILLEQVKHCSLV